jgi:hypothetical protein
MGFKVFATVATSLALAACGGSEPGVIGYDNRPPDISGTLTGIEVPENTTAPITSIAITDEDAASVTLTLEGPDRARFIFRNRTELVFLISPDFEIPTDIDLNNIYLVTVVATDSLGAQSRVNLAVSVTNVAEGVATRYHDQLFPQMTTIDQLQFAGSNGGTIGVTLLGPAGDLAGNRPLVLIASGSFFGPPQIPAEVIARQFVQRGYVVGLVDGSTATAFLANPAERAAETARGATELLAAGSHIVAQASHYGLDGARVLVAGEGTGALIAAEANVASGRQGRNLIRGALTIGGGLLGNSAASQGAGTLFAVHREGDARLSCAAGSCAMVQGFTKAGVSAQLMLLSGSAAGFSSAEVDAIFRNAANMFYSQVITTPS